jgi:hypothetical protein
MKRLGIKRKQKQILEDLTWQQLKDELDNMRIALDGYAKTLRVMKKTEQSYETSLLTKAFFWFARSYHFRILKLQYNLHNYMYHLMLAKAKAELLERHPGIIVLIQQGRVKDFDEFISKYLEHNHKKVSIN